MNLFLDDWRPCPNGFALARDYDECVMMMDASPIDVLSLDYNLGDGKTGYDVAMWIVKHGKWPNTIRFHSSDPHGRARMRSLLKQHAPTGVTIE